MTNTYLLLGWTIGPSGQPGLYRTFTTLEAAEEALRAAEEEGWPDLRLFTVSECRSVHNPTYLPKKGYTDEDLRHLGVKL